jgi:mycothiol system anti-sigma-R factor
MNQDGVYRSPRGPLGRPAVVHDGRSGSRLGKDPECREALNRLYHFLDGELTEERRHEIQSHLDTCQPCLEAFDFEAEVKLLIATRCRDEVPAQLRVRVALALREASGMPSAPKEQAPKEQVAPGRRSDQKRPHEH